jgi:phosphoglycolate phosphatase
VLFDLDGTLVETQIDFAAMRREVRQLAARVGLPEEALAGLDILEMVARIAQDADDPDGVRAEADAILTAIELAACAGAREMPGAMAMLEALATRGARVGIVTRNCRRAVTQILERVPLPHEVLLSRDEAPRVKPDPAHLRQAVEALGAPAAHTVIVGDHLMDVRAGKAAGMGTVGFLAPGRPGDFFDADPPDLVLSDLRELPAWIFPSSS